MPYIQFHVECIVLKWHESIITLQKTCIDVGSLGAFMPQTYSVKLRNVLK